MPASQQILSEWWLRECPLAKLNKWLKVTEPESGSAGTQACLPKQILEPVLSWAGTILQQPTLSFEDFFEPVVKCSQH